MLNQVQHDSPLLTSYAENSEFDLVIFVRATYGKRYLSFLSEQFLNIKAQGFICTVVSDKTFKMLSF